MVYTHASLTVSLLVATLLTTAWSCQNSIDIGSAQGVQIERIQGSRAEYDPLPDRLQLSPRDTLDALFRTKSQSGLLFALMNYEAGDLISAFLIRGHLVFARRCGTGNAFEIYRGRLDDGEWHRIRFIHTHKGGQLLIDGINHFRQYHMGPCANFRTMFIGGLPEQMALMNWPGTRESFQGCVKDMRLNGHKISSAPNYFIVSICDDF